MQFNIRASSLIEIKDNKRLEGQSNNLKALPLLDLYHIKRKYENIRI